MWTQCVHLPSSEWTVHCCWLLGLQTFWSRPWPSRLLVAIDGSDNDKCPVPRTPPGPPAALFSAEETDVEKGWLSLCHSQSACEATSSRRTFGAAGSPLGKGWASPRHHGACLSVCGRIAPGRFSPERSSRGFEWFYWLLCMLLIPLWHVTSGSMFS